MRITAIILSHFKQREKNLKRIVDDLMSGTVKPNEIVVFIDNPEISFTDKRVTVIKSDRPFLPTIRFSIGSYFTDGYCFFIDDDLSVRTRTLKHFVNFAEEYDDRILGFEGSILGNTLTPYSNDVCINRGGQTREVDIIIRTYFVPARLVTAGLILQSMYPELPRESLDDVYLCLGSKYLYGRKSMVIPIDNGCDLIELKEGGVRQSGSGDHYKNRNLVCRKLMDIYVQK